MADEVRAAGGVVERDGRVAVVHRPKYDDWSLPKGKLEDDESFETAALREVREETGVDAELAGSLGEVRYWYQRGGRRVAKVVSFFLLRYTGGSLDDHDAEVEEARWVPLEEAARTLSYAGEREMATRALSRIAEGE
jgi:8-oxo-dGTP pyrophosphatase MutT (NUDIX family)